MPGLNRRHLLRAFGVGAGLTVAAPLLAACGGAASPTAAPAKPASAEPTKPAPAAAAAAPTTAPAAPAPTKPADAAEAGRGGRADQARRAPAPAPAPQPASVTAGKGDRDRGLVRPDRLDRTRHAGRQVGHLDPRHLRREEPEVHAQGRGPGLGPGAAHRSADRDRRRPRPGGHDRRGFRPRVRGAWRLPADPGHDPTRPSPTGRSRARSTRAQLYGVPIYTSPFALETNVRVAKKAGLDPTKPPKTWDELVANSTEGVRGRQERRLHRLQPVRPGAEPHLRHGPAHHPLDQPDWQAARRRRRHQGVLQHAGARRRLRAEPQAVQDRRPRQHLLRRRGQALRLSLAGQGRLPGLGDLERLQRHDNKAESLYHPLPRKDANVSGNVVLGNAVFSPLAKAKNRDGAIAFAKFMAEPETQLQLGKLTVSACRLSPRCSRTRSSRSCRSTRTAATAVRTFADILLKEDIKPVPPTRRTPTRSGSPGATRSARSCRAAIRSSRFSISSSRTWRAC